MAIPTPKKSANIRCIRLNPRSIPHHLFKNNLRICGHPNPPSFQNKFATRAIANARTNLRPSLLTIFSKSIRAFVAFPRSNFATLRLCETPFLEFGIFPIAIGLEFQFFVALPHKTKKTFPSPALSKGFISKNNQL